MRWAMTMVVLVSCAGEAAPCEEAASGPSYRGFRWACDHALPCAAAIDCADPRWLATGASTLNAVAACVLGPCEARAPCVADAVAVCSIDAGAR